MAVEWKDEGIVLSARKHGETALIVSLLTKGHGRHLGLVRGGVSRRHRGVFQPGTVLEAGWRARLEDHLGTYTAEVVKSLDVDILQDPLKLAGLTSMCAMADQVLAERTPYPRVYEGARIVLQAMSDDEDWLEVYVKWEMGLLQEMGYGLDLEKCAATGTDRDLVYVSPKTGRAVSQQAGKPYDKSMLRLPAFLSPERDEATLADIGDGLAITGFFFEKQLLQVYRKEMPNARKRFVDRLKTLTSMQGSKTH